MNGSTLASSNTKPNFPVNQPLSDSVTHAVMVAAPIMPPKFSSFLSGKTILGRNILQSLANMSK